MQAWWIDIWYGSSWKMGDSMVLELAVLWFTDRTQISETNLVWHLSRSQLHILGQVQQLEVPAVASGKLRWTRSTKYKRASPHSFVFYSLIIYNLAFFLLWYPILRIMPGKSINITWWIKLSIFSLEFGIDANMDYSARISKLNSPWCLLSTSRLHQMACTRATFRLPGGMCLNSTIRHIVHLL
jgi:hypothetical protein